MKPSIEAKLDRLSERHEEIKHLLSDSSVITDNKRFMTLSKEYAELEPVVLCFHKYKSAITQKEENKNFLTDADADIRLMAEEEMGNLDKTIEQCEAELQILLLPKDPNDTKNTFLEIRAGTGGDEAAIFAGNLFRMYSRYAERMNWKIEVISESLGEHGGYKEVIARVIGENVYSNLKFESGAHRVQRVPTTESQGRVHTSACTVAIMPEVDDVEEVNIDPSELRIDTYKASGAGGQHVNKTDSAIRITHIPTGLVVESQEERSQHKNRAKAMSLLQSRLKQSQIDKQNQEQAATRRNLVGSGDRSERIRTYNFPQGRLTDHRINLTLYKLDEIMEGGLDDVIGPLRREHQTDLLASMGD